MEYKEQESVHRKEVAGWVKQMKGSPRKSVSHAKYEK